MSPNGKVELGGETASLVFERQLAHAPERVWRALTDPQELRDWYMAQAMIEGRPGGAIEMVTGPAGFRWTGRILTWQPFSRLEYEFNAEPHARLPGGERSIVRYDLRPVAGGTLLTLTHSRLTKRTAFGFAPGTHALLDRLEAFLAAEPLPNWTARYEEVRAAYPDRS